MQSRSLGDDPFSPKRLRLLRALADAMFAEPPADATARQENDELVASFAALFFPDLPEEQARSQLALMVTTLLETAAQRGVERANSTNGGLPGPDAARREPHCGGHCPVRQRARRRSRT